MGERHTEEMRLLGLTIAFYRRARGLTQSELAEAVQISRTHMSNIEAPNSHTSLSKRADGYCGSTRNSAENII